MNKLKGKEEKKLDTLNLSDLKRKVNEIVEFCNEVNETLELFNRANSMKEFMKEEEEYYRVIEKGLGGLDFGFIYSKEQLYAFNIAEGLFEPVKKPKEGDEYWFINSFGDICSDIDYDDKADNLRWKTGNVFNTEESANKHLERIME